MFKVKPSKASPNAPWFGPASATDSGGLASSKHSGGLQQAGWPSVDSPHCDAATERPPDDPSEFTTFVWRPLGVFTDRPPRRPRTDAAWELWVLSVQ